MLRGRVIATTYEYGDPDHPDRVTRTWASPAWSSEDHDVMLALAEYESTLCPGCGQPKEHAWHPSQEGWFDLVEFTCHSCMTLHGPDQAVYKTTTDTWPDGKPYPPWPSAPAVKTETSAFMPQ